MPSFVVVNKSCNNALVTHVSYSLSTPCQPALSDVTAYSHLLPVHAFVHTIKYMMQLYNEMTPVQCSNTFAMVMNRCFVC